MNKTGEIYIITNNINNKQYIGQTISGTRSRMQGHLCYARNHPNTLLARSLNKYGHHNFSIKTILICDQSQLNYFECKYIRQYNTMLPDGLNMIKGGSVHSGTGNPMYGKNHTPESIEKIRLSQIGKILPESVKKNMSISHALNKENGKLPPRRNHDNLPKYIYHVISSNKEGYEVRHHPILKQKQFVAKTKTLEENIERAVQYLSDINNEDNKRQPKEDVKKYDNLPRYIRQVASERYDGFEVKFNPKLKNKKWTCGKMSMDEKLNAAIEYLNK